MIFKKSGFASIIEDNEERYYTFMETLINSIDPQAEGVITKSPTAVTIRIIPSKTSFQKVLLQTVKEVNTTFSITVEFSKSISTSKSVVFRIST